MIVGYLDWVCEAVEYVELSLLSLVRLASSQLTKSDLAWFNQKCVP